MCLLRKIRPMGTIRLSSMQDSPIILIAGQEKCGKSSIVDVVFKRMSVYKTFFLDTTSSLKKYTSDKNPLLEYNIWELPSDMNEVRDEMKNIKPYISNVAILIYVFSLEVRPSPLPSFVEFEQQIQQFFECPDQRTDRTPIDAVGGHESAPVRVLPQIGYVSDNGTAKQ